MKWHYSSAGSIQDNNINPVLSLIVPCNDDLNEKAVMAKSYVSNICDNIGLKYIRHENIQPNIHVNVSKRI